MGAADAGGQNEPARHVLHTDAPAAAKEPAAHCTHDDARSAPEKEPAGHAAHEGEETRL
jgi:hypothetical protein